MKAIKTLRGSWLVLGAWLAGANAQPAPAVLTPGPLYYQAFLTAPDLAAADRAWLFDTDWRGEKLTARFGELIGRYDDQFKLVRRAAQATGPCDWGLDWSQGPGTRLPHLARAKAVAATAKLRVLWDLQQGSEAEARDDLLAALALGRRVSGDGTLISVLVQIAIEGIVCNSVAENFGRFSPATLKQLADGFDAAPPRGTVAGCLATEKACFGDFVVKKITDLRKQHPDNDALVMESIRSYFQVSPVPEQGVTSLWDRLRQAGGDTSEGLLKLLEEPAKMLQRATVPLTLPYPECERQMTLLLEEVKKSPNPLLSETLPSFWKGRTRELRGQVALAMVRAAVEYKLRGETGLQSVQDPCGPGPFAFRRFAFARVDRGFELRSAATLEGTQVVMIFVEKEGPPFRVDGPNAGQALSKPAARR